MIAPSPHNDARYVALLQRYDEELRRGALGGSTRDDGVPDETPPEERNVLDCLHLLERVWPRAGRGARACPLRIGRFHVERVLGHGGFGIVYLATDPTLKRQVALKVPRLHAFSQPALADRFRREARAAAALDHPGIIPVYEAGDSDDLLYIASAFCPGPTLGQWLKEQPGGIAPRDAAVIVAQLADAVAYSHSRGVLHRDIKPGNVLLVPRDLEGTSQSPPTPARLVLGGLGSPPYGFTPRLGDFGLAKVFEDAAADGSLCIAAETADGMTLGTPAYMSPEQSACGAVPIGPPADVYALGAVLYELLTGRPPFQGPNVADVLDQVRGVDPVPVRRLRRDVPRDLETICHKCLQKAPARRYASAADLGSDLERFQRGEPVRARPPGAAELTWKTMRRRPGRTAAIVLSALALTAFGIQRTLNTAALEEVNADLERTNARLQEALGAAQRSENAAREVAYAADIRSAWRARQEGDFVQYEQIIDRYREGTPLADYRGLEWHYLERLGRTEGRELLQIPHAIYSVVQSPDRRQLAVVGQDADLRIVDLATGNILSQWATGQKEVNAALYSPDGATLWTSGDDGSVCAWDTTSHREIERFVAHPEGAYDLAYFHHADPGQRRLITCGRENVIRLWHCGELRGVLEGHGDWVEEIELHPDGRRLVSVSQDGSARIWDVPSQQTLETIVPGSGKMRHAAISPTGRQLATCSEKVDIWDCDTYSHQASHETIDPPYRVCFAFGETELCVADRGGVIHLLQLETDDAGLVTDLAPGPSWRAHTDRPYAMVGAQDGATLVSAGKDGRVGVWRRDGLSSTDIRRFECQDASECRFASDPPRLIVASSLLNVVRYEEGFPQPLNVDHRRNWASVAVSPRGDLFASGSHWMFGGQFPAVRTWRLTDHASVVTVEPPVDDQTIVELSFSADGRTLAAAGASRLFLLDPYTGETMKQIDLHQGDTMCFSPVDADLIVVQTPTHTLRALNWRTEAVLWETAEMPVRPWEVVFTPDGQQIASIGPERSVRVWDAGTGEFIRELKGHRAMVMDVSVSSDGRTISSIDQDQVVKFWHVATGQFLCELHANILPTDVERSSAPFCAFSPDGRWFAVPGGNDAIQLLPLKQEQ